MSFILDALKKSESERQRQSVPGLLDVPMPAPKQRFPIWGVLLGLLLGVNLVVLLVVLVRSGSPQPAAAQNAVPATAPSPAAAANAVTAGAAPNYAPGAVANAPGSMAANAGAPVYGVPANSAPPYAAAPGYGVPQSSGAAPATPGAAPANGTPFSPMDAPEIPVAQGGTAPGAATPSAGYMATPSAQTRAPVQEPPTRSGRATLPPQAQIPPEPDEIVPTLQEVNLTGNHGIPELHLDIHVYANRPADRFVFINNRKYKEGSTLQEGPTVERITRDGVLLRYQNLRFSIPRQ